MAAVNDEFSVRVEGGIAFLSGEIDAASRGMLVNALMILDDVVTARVDMSQVTFIDSRGLGALIDLHLRRGEGAVPLEILDPSDVVRRLLFLTGLTEVFRLVDR